MWGKCGRSGEKFHRKPHPLTPKHHNTSTLLTQLCWALCFFHANILLIVKNCYKIKIDYRDSYPRFSLNFLLSQPSPTPNVASLICKTSTFAMQLYSFWKVKVLQLEGKCSPFSKKCSIFTLSVIVTFRFKSHNTLTISRLSSTAQNSRISSQTFRRAFNKQF